MDGIDRALAGEHRDHSGGLRRFILLLFEPLDHCEILALGEFDLQATLESGNPFGLVLGRFLVRRPLLAGWLGSFSSFV